MCICRWIYRWTGLQLNSIENITGNISLYIHKHRVRWTLYKDLYIYIYIYIYIYYKITSKY